jgi:hypothetical protein
VITTNLDLALKTAHEVEGAAVGVFNRDRFQCRAEADNLVVAMAVRCLSLFRGVIRCADDRLAEPAMVLTRSLLE